MAGHITRLACVAGAFCLSIATHAQDVQTAAAAAAKEIAAAPKAEQVEEKPNYWTESLVANFGFTETSLTNWAAGGYNTITLITNIDGNANYKKDEMFWNNHLALDYGFIYSDDKPFMQKNNDRIYFESKWGYKASKTLSYSANYNFRSQFSDSYKYNNPGVQNPGKEDWLNAATLMSGLMSPAYTDIGLGIDWVPNKWLSANFSPLTGGFTIVSNEALRAKYSMPLKPEITDEKDILDSYYKSARFEFGAKLKLDAKFSINEVFNYATQIVLFSDYLNNPQNLRVNWDNSIDWKIAKYFTIAFKTFLIYDDKIFIVDPSDVDLYPKGRQRVQFKEYLTFNFSYTFKPRRSR